MTLHQETQNISELNATRYTYIHTDRQTDRQTYRQTYICIYIYIYIHCFDIRTHTHIYIYTHVIAVHRIGTTEAANNKTRHPLPKRKSRWKPCYTMPPFADEGPEPDRALRPASKRTTGKRLFQDEPAESESDRGAGVGSE